MMTPEQLQALFARQGGCLSTAELRRAGVHYRKLQQLLQSGTVECVRRGYYLWVADTVPSDAATLVRLFPDAVFCMQTALYCYGYTDRVPHAWHLAVSRFINRKRFCLRYPMVQPHYCLPEIQRLGVSTQKMEGVPLPMHDRDRVICDCLRFRNHMDREIFNKALRAYLADERKNLGHLLGYANRLRCRKSVFSYIEPWL